MNGAHGPAAPGTDTSFLLLLLTALVLLAYLGGARRLWSRWPVRRNAWFVLGIGMILIAVSPPVTHWAHHDLRGHMAQHLLLGMFAPLALVLGMPLTLLLRNLPPASARTLTRLLASGPVRTLTHPLTALALDMGAMWLLYLTPLFALAMNNAALHLWLHLHFVLAGYLYTWAIAGPDPAPRRPGMRFRLGVLLAGGAIHAVLGKLMYAGGHPRGMGFDVGELEAAARWMYYGGDVAELLLALMFFGLWFGDRHASRKHRLHPAPGGAAATAAAAVALARHGGGRRAADGDPGTRPAPQPHVTATVGSARQEGTAGKGEQQDRRVRVDTPHRLTENSRPSNTAT